MICSQDISIVVYLQNLQISKSVLSPYILKIFPEDIALDCIY